ncbi:MAG: hypothetical protein ACOYKA_02015 [Legionellaceae bacterium]
MNRKIELLARTQQRKLDEMNQPIYFQDLIIRDMSSERFCSRLDEEYSVDIRLVLYIHSLFEYINTLHRQSYCESCPEHGYRLKDGYKNHITRLLTTEFSFYSKDPLTLEQWNDVLQKIESYALKLEDNVHFLLSSFSVLDIDNKLHNVTLYIEGGTLARLHVLSKNTSFVHDWDYKTTLFSQQEQGKPPTHHADYIISKHAMMSTDSVFEITTQGGAHYIQSIDVCLDHAYGHSRKIFDRRLRDKRSNLLIPDQIEQCVTSNTIALIPKNLITTHVLHVDPLHELNPRDLKKIERINQEPLDLKTDHVAMFGSSFTIEILHERPAGRHCSGNQIDIDLHNKNVMNRRLQAKLTLTRHHLFFSIESKDHTYNECLSLIEKMSDFKLAPHDKVMQMYIEQLSTNIEKAYSMSMSSSFEDLSRRIAVLEQQNLIREVYFFYEHLLVFSRSEYDRISQIKDWILDIPIDERHNDSIAVAFWVFEKNNYHAFVAQHERIFLKINDLHQSGFLAEKDWCYYHDELNDAISTYDLQPIQSELLTMEVIIIVLIATKRLCLDKNHPYINQLEQLFQSIPMTPWGGESIDLPKSKSGRNLLTGLY